jgi:hypothetical protein
MTSPVVVCAAEEPADVLLLELFLPQLVTLIAPTSNRTTKTVPMMILFTIKVTPFIF